MANPIAEVFLRAVRLAADDPRRQGNCLTFSAGDQVVYTGDIHGNLRNLARIIAFCDLPRRRDRRLVLHEIIHCESGAAGGADGSVDALLRAVRLKLSCPEQVFFLLGNHDLAELTGQEITKQGRGVCQAFAAALDGAFGRDAGAVHRAICHFLGVLPLAGRCPNGMFMTHSLPSPNRMKLIDWDILQRPYRTEDFRRGGTLYEWTWGRGHTAEQLEVIAARLGVRQFLLGHQPVESGCEIRHGRAVILSSDHPYGAVMAFDAARQIPDQDLLQCVRPISGL